MINKIIRNFIAKQMAGRSDDGIMITLKDPQKVTFAENIMMDLLLRNGVDPRAITNETQLKNILQQIKNVQAANIRNTDVSGIRGTRPAQILDMEGKEIPQGSQIMGGKAMETEAEIAARFQKGNKEAVEKIKMQKMIDDAIDDASPGFSDGDTKYDAELVAENLAERMGLVYDDLPTKQRLDIYDQAYTGLSKQRFKGMKKPDDDPENMADGGRIGLKGGGLTPSDYLKVKDMLNHWHRYKRMGKPKISKADFAAAFFRENNADGGRIGYFMGSKLPKGLATLRQMLNFMGKKSDKVKNPSDVLKMVNPKSLNMMLEDPKLQGKINVKEGILATDTVKNFQNKMGEDRVQLVKDMLSAAKNIRGADTNQLRLKNEMIEDMMKKGVDRQMAEEMATVMSRLAEDMTGKFKDTPKLTDEGILELENILKNMETGNKPKRDLNADGGRIGLKDGMNRRTFMKFLAGLASLPIVGKIVKPLKTVKGVKNVPIIKTGDVPGKPEWFDQLVNKVIIEGDDVTKRFATQDRQVVHMKKIDDETSVTVTQDLEDGSIMVDIDDPIRNVMGESGNDTSVTMMLKKGQADEITKVKPADEFSFTENDMRNYMDGPDDYTTEFTENTVNRMKDLTSDLGKIKSYATGKGPTMKQIVESKKRQDKVRFAEDKPAEYAADRAPDIDYSDYDDGMASGGIAGMLGE